MNMYEVSLVVQAHRVTVEAEDEDSARRAAFEDNSFVHTHAMWEDWLVDIPVRDLEDWEVLVDCDIEYEEEAQNG